MNTQIIEPTQGQQRKAKAIEGLKKLQNDRGRLKAEQQAAEVSMARLNAAIATATRSSDAEALKDLRAERALCEATCRDFPAVQAQLDREIELASAEAKMAEVEVNAETYNSVVDEQRAMTVEVVQQIRSLVSLIATKERRAVAQERIQGAFRPYPELSPTGMRLAFLQAITEALQNEGGRVSPFLHSIDWTCRRMTTQGDLLSSEIGQPQ